MKEIRYFALVGSEFVSLSLAKYKEWYAYIGRDFGLKETALGFHNTVFGGYNGRVSENDKIITPFYLTYSYINQRGEFGSYTTYFETFEDLQEEFEYLLNYEWEDWSLELDRGWFDIPVSISM